MQLIRKMDVKCVPNCLGRCICLWVFPAWLAVCGCKPDVAELDALDVGQPLMKKAALKAEEGDLQSAVRLYQKVLDDNRDVARAHLDMALLLDDHLKDYVPAIYHYRRYLDLRGTTEKRAMIEERIRRAEQMFAAGILMPSKRADRVTALERENRLLRVKLGAAARRLEKLEEEVARNRLVAESQTASAPPPAGALSVDRPKTYTVQKGDFLTKISEKVYGDPKRWREIRDANRDTLGSRTDVRPGQVLVIP